MKIKHLYVDAGLEDNAVVCEVSQNLGLAPKVLASRHELYQLVATQPDPIAAGKEHLILTQNKGAFIKDCPGTRDYICCGYQILHIGTFCNMDCSYCILQAYFHPPVMQYFVNYNDMFSELAKLVAKGTTFRIGTGEFTDSLIWEGLTDLNQQLVTKIGQQNVGVLELKTKTVDIHRLQNLPHNGKTILAWSLNTPQVICEQERGTSSLNKRLLAAKQAQDWGYPIALHFDPMVLYACAEADYLAVIDDIANTLDQSRIAWLSIGSFRCMPELKPVIETRFPQSKLPYGELIVGDDAKLRYFKPLRMALYKSFVGRLKERLPDVFAYFCMEDAEVWQATFGFNPNDHGGLSFMLDESIRKTCGLR